MHRQEQYKNTFRFSLSLIIWFSHLMIWAYVWTHEYERLIFDNRGNWLVLALYGFISFFFSNLYGGYRIGYSKRDDIFLSNCIAVFFTNTLTYLQICLMGRTLMTVQPFVFLTVANIIIFWIWSIAASMVYAKVFPPHKMLMVYGGGDLATNLAHKMASYAGKYCIQEAIGIDADKEVVIKKILAYPSVVLCDMPGCMRDSFLKICFENNIRTYITPQISDILIRSADELTLFDTPLLLNRNYGLTLEQQFIKRSMDIAFSMVMLILFFPFALIAAIIIKLQDGGPVLYKQMRSTINGREFYIYKFRSMIVDAEKDGPRLASEKDSRITPFGRVIRRYRLDELPQLWNILLGDMSLVGPRPERIEHVMQYTTETPEFHLRLKVRAGLTGYAQITGKYNTSPQDKLKMDLMYIAKYSLLWDLKIIFVTIKTLLQKDNAQGVQE